MGKGDWRLEIQDCHSVQVQLSYMLLHGTHVQKTVALACSESGVFGPVTSRGHDIYTCPFGGWAVPTSLNWLELGNS